MGNINGLILKIFLGVFAAINFAACIITTDFKVLVPLNLVVAIICFGIYLFIESNISGLAKDLGISKKDASKLVGEYFVYYKNVERIPIDEYLKRSLNK
jgi:hypothetical protein